MALDQLTDQEKDILLNLSYIDLPEKRDLQGKDIEVIWEMASLKMNEDDERYILLNDFFTSCLSVNFRICFVLELLRHEITVFLSQFFCLTDCSTHPFWPRC